MVMTGQLQHQSSGGGRGPVAGDGGRIGKSGKFGISHGKGEGHVVHAGVNCVCVMCVAPPTHVGAWSMAVLLRQPLEYYRITDYFFRWCHDCSHCGIIDATSSTHRMEVMSMQMNGMSKSLLVWTVCCRLTQLVIQLSTH